MGRVPTRTMGASANLPWYASMVSMSMCQLQGSSCTRWPPTAIAASASATQHATLRMLTVEVAGCTSASCMPMLSLPSDGPSHRVCSRLHVDHVQRDPLVMLMAINQRPSVYQAGLELWLKVHKLLHDLY